MMTTGSMIMMTMMFTMMMIKNVQAYKELGLLMLLVGVAVLTFASLVYFAEKVSLTFSLTRGYIWPPSLESRHGKSVNVSTGALFGSKN